jgi:hypothetical protein
MQRSLEKLRSEGWICYIVEKFNRFSMRTVDAFSFGDILAMNPKTRQIALVQTTSGSNVSSHLIKIKSLPTFKQWHDSGGITIVHGWRKLKHIGWTCRELKTQQKKPLA